MDPDPRVEVIINRCKLKRNNNSSGKVVGYIEGHSKENDNYNQSICISNTVVITPNSSLSISIPKAISLVSLVLYLSITNNTNNANNTNTLTKIGFSEIHIDSSKETVINVLDINSGHRIGKLYCHIIINNGVDTTNNDDNIHGADIVNESSDFIFQQLSKPIKWGKLQSINIERVLLNNNVDSIMSCIDDIRYGDLSREQMDPFLYNSIRVSQYSVQYLLYCQQLLNSRSSVIKSAIDTFDKEEEMLDIKLAKLRAREKALRRESKSLDDMHKNYVDVFDTLDPKLCQKYLKRLGKKRDLKTSIDNLENDKDLFKKKSQAKESSPSMESNPLKSIDNLDFSESDEVVGNNANEVQLVDVEDDVDLLQSKQSLKASSKLSIDSLFIQKHKVSEEPVISWNSKPSWVDAANKVSSSLALSSLAISIDSLNINKNTETFEEDSLLVPNIARSAPPSKTLEIAEKREEIRTSSHKVESTTNQDINFMNESWDDSSDFEEKKEEKKEVPVETPRSMELEDFEEKDSPDRQQEKTANFIEIKTSSIRQRYSDYDDHNSISTTAKNFAKNAEAKLLKSIQEDTEAASDEIPTKKSNLEYDNLYGKVDEVKRYDPDAHDGSYDMLYGSSEIDASMSIEIDPFAESSNSNTNSRGYDYEALSKTANAVIASYTSSKGYEDQAKEDFKSDGLRTGVLNYLHNEMGRDISPSTVNFNATNSGRMTYEDGGDDVLFGTARLKESFTNTGSTQKSQYSDNTSSGDDIDQKLDELMSKSHTDNHDKDTMSDLSWINGRAPLDMIEVAHALDLLVSAISLNPELHAKHPKTKIVIEFMGINSTPSSILPTNLNQSFSAINYAVHLLFNNREASLQLSKYIENEGMNISVSINIIDDSKGIAIGQAVVDLYVMIEDEKPLIRQEIDVMSTEMGNIIGSAVVDVRGYQVLLRCS